MKTDNMTQITDLAKNIIASDVSPVDEKIYEIVFYLAEERKRQNITQEKLAQLSGLTKNTISRIETLVSTPTLPAILKIAFALNVDLVVKTK